MTWTEKTMRAAVVVMLGGMLSVAVTGCNEPEANGDEHEHTGPLAEVSQLVAVMTPTAGNDAHGTVTFEQSGESVQVTAEISGLEPNSTHAIHVHQYGDIRAEDGTSAGGHYNPEGHDHALPDEEQRHAGDLGNLQADADGNASYEISVDNITLAGHTNPVIGRAVIIHAGEDDGSQPTGAAGSRISNGVIGVANPEQ